MAATPLSRDTLGALSVPTPPYDRDGLTVGIVHIGVGGFHRAHQAVYLDTLMAAGQAHDWALCGVGGRGGAPGGGAEGRGPRPPAPALHPGAHAPRRRP